MSGEEMPVGPWAFNLLVGAIAVFEASILLIQRGHQESFLPGVWGLPAGKVAFGERLEDAVLRELKEESGLTGTVRALTGYSSFPSRKGGARIHNVQINFVVDCDDRVVRLEAAAEAYKWVKLPDLSLDIVDEFTLQAIRQAQL